ncbi:MAG: hypothetical protein ACRCXC_11310 [Legionella sp.]
MSGKVLDMQQNAPQLKQVPKLVTLAAEKIKRRSPRKCTTASS